MTGKNFCLSLVLSSLLITPLYASSNKPIVLDDARQEEDDRSQRPQRQIQAANPTPLKPFTRALSSKVRCVLEKLPGLIDSRDSQRKFETLGCKNYHDDVDPKSSMIERYINLFRYGYYFKTSSRGPGVYKKLNQDGLDEKFQKTKLKELISLTEKHRLLVGARKDQIMPFEKNAEALDIAIKIAEDTETKMTALQAVLPPIDFKTTLVRTLAATTRSCTPQPDDKTHHQSEFVEPISGRLFKFDLQTTFTFEREEDSETLYPYDLANEELHWGVNFVSTENRRFSYNIFLLGGEGEVVIGNITLQEQQ